MENPEMRDLPLPTLPLSDLIAPAAATRRSLHPAHAQPEPVRFSVAWARDEADVRAAQRLRYAVFAEEMGARLAVPAGAPEGHDVDVFDDFCEHLLVRAPAGADGEADMVIGTYRVLTPAAARRVGGLYSDTEFDLTRLRPLRARMVELGRTCVHPDWRSGSVILALWGALAEFMARNGLETMVGCASVGMRDGGHVAASLWEQLRGTHLAPIEWRVHPRLALPVDELRRDLAVEPPALIKGYLRCGAKLLGAPAWDPDFGTADLPMMLRFADLPPRYRRHFGTA
jgi:putative hemolysin